MEPLVGYRKINAEFSLSNLGATHDGDYEFEVTGPEFGLKLGYALPLAFVVGVDYRIGTDESEQKSGTAPLGGGDGGESTNLGVFVGFTTVPLFNFWVNYKFEFKTKESEGDDKGDYDKGTGYGVGVGFTGLPFVSINLEYNKYTMDETFDASTGVVTSLPTNNESDRDVTEIVLGVSVPFDFF